MTKLARFNRWYWRRLRRYRYEICDRCGRPVGQSCPSYWRADDALWLEVIGTPEGIRCVPCFTEEAREEGVSLHWEPVIDARQKFRQRAA